MGSPLANVTSEAQRQSKTLRLLDLEWTELGSKSRQIGGQDSGALGNWQAPAGSPNQSCEQNRRRACGCRSWDEQAGRSQADTPRCKVRWAPKGWVDREQAAPPEEAAQETKSDFEGRG